jgi:voltage-gated potassium channel
MSRVERWERKAEVPLLLLALAFLVAYAIPVLNTSVDASLRTFFSWCSWTVWVAFAGDFVIRVYLASDDRWRYIRRHWYDGILIVLPVLRPLRITRVLALARIVNRSAVGSLIGQVATYVAGTAVMSVGLASVAILDAEQRAPGSNIKSFGDALWWAMETVTTVGYGDRFPVTTQGRIIAGALMIVGIATVGAITATVAAWLVDQVRHPSDRKTLDGAQAGNDPSAVHDDAPNGYIERRSRRGLTPVLRWCFVSARRWFSCLRLVPPS